MSELEHFGNCINKLSKKCRSPRECDARQFNARIGRLVPNIAGQTKFRAGVCTNIALRWYLQATATVEGEASSDVGPPGTPAGSEAGGAALLSIST